MHFLPGFIVLISTHTLDRHKQSFEAFELGMPQKYREHYLCKQVRTSRFRVWPGLFIDLWFLHDFAQIKALKDIDSLKDVTIGFG